MIEKKSYRIERFPKTKNSSLRPWSSADEYLLNFFHELKIDEPKTLLINDRFGYLATHLHAINPISVIEQKSQEKSVRGNYLNNDFEIDEEGFISPLDEYPKDLELVLLRMPKSLDLFRLYLQQLSKYMTKDTVVAVGFMTKFFSSQSLKIADEYFDDVSQSLAWKKSRLLILKQPKPFVERPIIKEVKINDTEILKQYYGVFSSKNVDYATQYLLEEMKLQSKEQNILDLGSGNGVIAYEIHKQFQENKWEAAQIHSLDSSFLAIESSKLNLPKENFHFHFDDDLKSFSDDYFDLVVSNPPFHFEYEINTEITLGLFNQVHRCLKPGGRFIMVANRHLNYKGPLLSMFTGVVLLSENPKFVVCECYK